MSAILEITLRDPIKTLAEAQAAAAGFASVEEYLGALVRANEPEPVDAATEAKLKAALDSPARVTTRADIEEMARRFASRHSNPDQR